LLVEVVPEVDVTVAVVEQVAIFMRRELQLHHQEMFPSQLVKVAMQLLETPVELVKMEMQAQIQRMPDTPHTVED
jgi:hypothetical protein